MDLIFALVVLTLAAAPIALLSGWFDRRESRSLGTLLAGRDRDTWWRATMPWPQGVQEDTDMAWSARDPNAPGAPGRAAGPDAPDEVWIEPIHLRPLVRRR